MVSALGKRGMHTQPGTISLPQQSSAKVSLLELLVCFTGLCISAFALVVGAPVVLIAFCVLGIVGWLITKRWGKTASRLFVLVYCCSVLAAITLYAIYLARYGAPYYNGGSDDIAYEEWAQVVVSSLGVFDYSSIRGGVVRQSYNSAGYVYLVSLLYRASEPLGGFHTMLPRLLNCLALGLLAVTTYLLGKRYGLAEQTSRWAALFVGLSPIMIYNTVHTFRDTIVSLLMIWVVYSWSESPDRPAVRRRLWSWMQTLVIVGITSQMRMPLVFPMLAIAAIGDVLSSKPRLRRSVKLNLYRLAMVVVLIIGAVFVFRTNVDWFMRWLSRSSEYYTSKRIDISDGLSNYVFDAPVPLTYVLRVGYALILPLPLFSREIERLWLSVGTGIQFFFLPFLAAGLFLSMRDRTKWHLLSAFVILFAGTLITFTSRHFSQFFPYGPLIAGVGFERYHKYRDTVWMTTLGLGVGLAVAYVVLKS